MLSANQESGKAGFQRCFYIEFPGFEKSSLVSASMLRSFFDTKTLYNRIYLREDFDAIV